MPARYQSDGSRVRSCVPERESLLHHDDFRRCITKRCITKDEIGGGFGHGDRDIIVDSRWCRVQDFLYLEGIGLSVQNTNSDLPLPHSAANVYQAFRMRGPIEDDGDGSSVGPLVRRGLDAHG